MVFIDKCSNADKTEIVDKKYFFPGFNNYRSQKRKFKQLSGAFSFCRYKRLLTMLFIYMHLQFFICFKHQPTIRTLGIMIVHIRCWVLLTLSKRLVPFTHLLSVQCLIRVLSPDMILERFKYRIFLDTEWTVEIQSFSVTFMQFCEIFKII